MSNILQVKTVLSSYIMLHDIQLSNIQTSIFERIKSIPNSWPLGPWLLSPVKFFQFIG